MNTKVIVCDLDGTLAPSKSALEPSMARIICQVLKKHRFAVISGGSHEQFIKQFLSHLVCEDRYLANLYLFPTNGSACYAFDYEHNLGWKKLYDEQLTVDERKKIKDAFSRAIPASGVVTEDPFGEIVEDRGGQITFSGRGQEAPLDVKAVWDPDQTKRRKIVDLLKLEIPEFEIRMGGATSIDVTHPGITKAYAIGKIKEVLGVSTEDIVFIGDALYSGGNDESAKETGVECIAVSGPTETEKVLAIYI